MSPSRVCTCTVAPAGTSISTLASAWQSSLGFAAADLSNTITSTRPAGVAGSLVLSMRLNSICAASSERTCSSSFSQPRTFSVPEATQSVTIAAGSTVIVRSIFSPGWGFELSLAAVAPARETRRPITAQTANHFFLNLEPALSVSATSADTGVGNRIEEIYFALISSKHEIGRVGIIWIALSRATSGLDSAIDHCEIAFKLHLQSRSHALFVRLNG